MDSLKCLEGEYANSQKYPNLAKILRRYYCPLPGSAASERLLSTARHFLRSTRLRLKPKNFESLLLKYNLRTLDREKEHLLLTSHPNSCLLPPHVNFIDESFTNQEDDEKSDIDISDDEDEIEAHVRLWSKNGAQKPKSKAKRYRFAFYFIRFFSTSK